MNTQFSKSVLLLKSQKESGADKYEELLTSNNFKVRQVKTIDFKFKNIEDLAKLLNKPEDYSGIIFSSPRCVKATSLALNDEKISDEWLSKNNYVVGETTYTDVLNKIGLDCLGKETGNAVNLSKLIIKSKEKFNKPFLFPHGNLKTDTLNTELSKFGLNIEGVLVYDTVTNENIENELKEATENYRELFDYIVLFSPSGLNSSVEYLKNGYTDLTKIRFIAIGPVTENALKEKNINVFKVCKNPTPNDVLSAIMGI